MDQRRVKVPRQPPRHAQRAGVPGDMRLTVGIGKAKRAEAGREVVRGMFADNQERTGCRAVFDPHHVQTV